MVVPNGALKIHHNFSAAAVLLEDFIGQQVIGLCNLQIFLAENLKYLARGDLPAAAVAGVLDEVAEFRVHGLGQVIAEALAHHKGRPALAGLAVNADNGLVLAAQIRRVDGQIGYLPVGGILLLQEADTLVDSILMRAGKGGEHQLARIRVALVHLHLGTLLIDFPHMVHVGEIQLRIHTLRIEVHGHVHDIRVAGAFAVSEQGALHTVCPGHNAQLGGRRTGTPVVVGVNTENGAVPVLHVPVAVFHLIRIGIGGGHFHRVGKVYDDLVLRVCAQLLQDLITDQYGIFHLCAGKALGRILIADIDIALCRDLLGQLPNKSCPADGNIDHALHIRVEHHLPLQSRGGIIEMNDHVLRPFDGLKGFPDQMLSGLYQHLHRHVLRDQVLLNERPQDLIFRFGGRGKAHLDLLKADIAQKLKIFQLLLQVHGVDQRLIAVPQIHTAPNGRLCDHLVRPGAVRQSNGLEGLILFVALIHKKFHPFTHFLFLK